MNGGKLEKQALRMEMKRGVSLYRESCGQELQLNESL